MSKEQVTENREQIAISSEEKKSCCDCLHCKVSAMSDEECRLCFCSQTAEKETHEEPFWLVKTVCQEFVDMSA